MKIYKYNNKYLAYSVVENKIFLSDSIENLNREETYVCNNSITHENLLNRNFNKIQLTLITTSNCNMKCKYCYEDNDLFSYSKKPFSLEQLRTTYEIFKSNYPNHEMFICFFGGEPFIEKDEIKKFIKETNQRCLDNGDLRPKYGAITNGTLIDEETAKLIVNNFDKLTISLDGTKIVHDENRVYRNGIGTFDNVYNNIKFLKSIDRHNKLDLACELTLTDAYIKYYNETLIDEIWTLLKDMGFKTVDFVPVRDENSKLFSDIVILEKITQKIIDLWFEDLINGKDVIHVPSLYNYLALLLGNRNDTSLCTSGYNYFSINSDLEIFPCQISIYFDNNKIGQIKDDNLHIDFSKLKKYSNKSEFSICKQCECIGGCSSFCKVFMSNLDENCYPDSCLYNKILFKQILFKLTDINYDLEAKMKLKNNLIRLAK